MSSVIYHVLDLYGDSTIKLNEQQMVDLESRIRFSHSPSDYKGLNRDELLALGNMKVTEINDPDLSWD